MRPTLYEMRSMNALGEYCARCMAAMLRKLLHLVRR